MQTNGNQRKEVIMKNFKNVSIGLAIGFSIAAAIVATPSPAKSAEQFVPKMGRNCPNATRDQFDGTCKLNTSVDAYWVNPNGFNGGTSCRGQYFYSEGYCVRTR